MFEVRKRSRLPHWVSDDSNYFVTFNLYDAMTREYVDRLEAERFARVSELEKLKGSTTPAELHAIEELIRERAEECLDEGAGSCFMKGPRVAEIVASAITHFDGNRYMLFAWCVMPNHAHVVFKAKTPLDEILHSWKSYSSKQANKLLKRTGEFWQNEYYDRTIRSQKDLKNTIKYVLENPPRAGLTDWHFVRSYPERT